MKKVIEMFAVALLSMGIMMGAASADPTTTCGSITNTGANSTNTVTCVDQNNVDVICNNNVIAEVQNSQTATTGTAFTVDNTYSGGATSGNSNNGSTETVNLGDNCAPVTTAAATTNSTAVASTPPKTTTPTAAAPVTKLQPTTVASLPNTGTSKVLEYSVITLVILAGTFLVRQFGLKAYRKF